MNEELMKQLEAQFKTVLEQVLPDQISAAVAPEVENKVKEMLSKVTLSGMQSAHNRSGISNEAKAQFADMIKDVAKHDIQSLREKALSEGTDTAGGYLVPNEVSTGIARIIEDYGIVRKNATKFPMKSDTMILPKLATAVTVSWPGENTEATASDAVLGVVTLAAKTAVGLTVLSNELLQDASVDIVDFLLALFAQALAEAEDQQGLAGNGSPFTGVLNASGTTVVTMAATKTTFSDVTADNLRDLITQVKPSLLAGAGYVMHRTVFAIVQKLKDSTGNYIVTAPTPVVITVKDNVVESALGSPQGYIWGYPVYLSDKMPTTTAISTKFIIFGGLRYIYFGDRQQRELAISDDATIAGVNVFAANQKAVRVTERVAIAVGVPEAFAILKTAAA